MKRLILLLVAAVLLMALTACAIEPEEEAAATAEPRALDEYSSSLLGVWQPLPEQVDPENYEITEELVDLGRMLYYEERISISQEISCNNCHLLDQYGVDNLQFSLGHDGQPVGRNSPTVYNAALHFAQFWDGRAADVEEQAQGPILAAGEMGMPDPDYVMMVLETIPGYVDLFATTFPDDEDPMNYDNVGRAIGAFERRLLTPSRFNQLLEGDESALNEQEKRGLALFVNVGCTTCHYGEAVGGERFAILGQAHPWPNLTDAGRFDITGVESDRYQFKVPGLLNIEMTHPYLHDGSITTLEEMITLMAHHQLDRDLTEEQVADIKAFLLSMTGELPLEYIAVPEFPESGPDTPGPYEAETKAAVEQAKK